MIDALKPDLLIDFIADDEDITFAAQSGDELEFVAGKDLAGRIVRRVQQEHAGIRRNRPFKRLTVERPIRRRQSDRFESAKGQDTDGRYES